MQLFQNYKNPYLPVVSLPFKACRAALPSRKEIGAVCFIASDIVIENENFHHGCTIKTWKLDGH